jgi:hypothetical protein
MGDSGDILASFNPLSFLEAAEYLQNAATCGMAVKGSWLTNFVPSSSFEFAAVTNTLIDSMDLIGKLPVELEQYYFLGAFATGIAGLTYGGLPEMQIVAALQPCVNDYFFAMRKVTGYLTTTAVRCSCGAPAAPAGTHPQPSLSDRCVQVEIVVPVGELGNLTLAVTGLGFSEGATIISSADVAANYPTLAASNPLKIDSSFWTPWGTTALGIRGQVWAQGSGTLSIGMKALFVELVLKTDVNVLVNYDPVGDGTASSDNQFVISAVAGPAIKVPVLGAISLDALASASVNVYWSYMSDDDFAIAVNLDVEEGLSSVISAAMPFLPDVVVDAITVAFPSEAASLDLYISDSAWGVQFSMSAAGGMSAITAIYSILALVEGWPDEVCITRLQQSDVGPHFLARLWLALASNHKPRLPCPLPAAGPQLLDLGQHVWRRDALCGGPLRRRGVHQPGLLLH